MEYYSNTKCKEISLSLGLSDSGRLRHMLRVLGEHIEYRIYDEPLFSPNIISIIYTYDSYSNTFQFYYEDLLDLVECLCGLDESRWSTQYLCTAYKILQKLLVIARREKVISLDTI